MPKSDPSNQDTRSAKEQPSQTQYVQDPLSSPDETSVAPPKSGEKKKRGKVTQVGDFKLMKKLGQGGMGTVYLALQVSLDRKVALKTLSKELADRPNLVERFLRECRSMAKLQHPNIVQVFAADSFKGYHFVAIEFIDGKSLQDWMNELGKMSIGDALHIVLVCAEALKQAHDLNIIHRDIKPDNVLLTKKGVVKVADFGLAKAIDEDVSMTASGVGMGTPLYMPPEQARNAKHVDKRTDIYALGTMLYYFLSGKLPYSGESTIEVIIAKEKTQYPPIRRVNPDVPERLELMIDKMLAKDPDLRYGDMENVIVDLSGLEMDNPTLSFIDAPDAAVVTRTPGKARGIKTAAAQARGKKSSKLVGEEYWYVRHRNGEGKSVVAKMDTARVRKALKAGMFDTQAKAARKRDGDYIPLAQYAQFSAEVHSVAMKEKAEKHGRKNMNQLYDQIDKEERRRQQWRWIKRKLEGVGGFVQLLLYLALLAAIGYGLYWAYNHYLADKIAEFTGKINAE